MFYEFVERTFALERAGRSIVKLNLGDTNLPTPEPAIRVATAAIARGRSGYGPAAGLPMLRERIARREGCEVENVVVGPGSKHLLFGLMSVLCSAGDRIAIPVPAWPAYGMAARRLRLEVSWLPSSLESGWRFDPRQAAGCRLLLACNPTNPASTLTPAEDLEQALDVMEATGGQVLLDEAYRGLAFEEVPRHPRALRVRTFSKEFSLEGWRLGYAVLPAPLARELVGFLQATTTCVPAFIQEAGAACLDAEAALLGPARALWQERSQAAVQALEAAGFRFAAPRAGMYVFATHERLHDADTLALRLLERGVAVASGSGFGPFNRFVRICVNQPPAVLRESIGRLAAELERDQP